MRTTKTARGVAIVLCIAVQVFSWTGGIYSPALGSGTASNPGATRPPESAAGGWRYEREAEAFDTASVGKPGDRSSASGTKALLQFGCREEPPCTPQAGHVPCTPQAGHVQFGKLEVPEAEHLWISLRYSKNGEPGASIQIFLDDEKGARTELTPEDRGSWNDFAWSDPMDLGAVRAGTHRLRFSTAGQLNGVADLDKFVLSLAPVVDPMHFLELSDDEFLERVSLATFQFFREQADPETGVVKDRAGNVVPDSYTVGSTGATGFGLAALCIGAKRGWVSAPEASRRALDTLRFFLDRPASPQGFFYHFLDLRSGERSWGSELSSIDTALLVAGAITAGRCFAGTEVERLANTLYERVDWDWMRTDGGAVPQSLTMSMGWMPEHGFLPNRWDFYSELMVLYLLALGSPTHPIPSGSWQAWKRLEGEYGGHRCIEGGPLFMHQYTHAFVDFKGRKDRLGYDYFENSVQCTLANRQFTMDQMARFKTYDEHVWGLTASDTPAGGYDAYGAPPSAWARHDGTVNPSAPAGSIIFTPELSIAALRTIYNRYGHRLWGRYGFGSAFNVDRQWWSREVVGIDTGITLLMIENYRSGLIQDVFMSHPAVRKALDVAGFVPN